MFLTISLPAGLPKEIIMPHYFLQEIDTQMMLWCLRILLILGIVCSVVVCSYYEKKAQKNTPEEIAEEEEEE